MARLARKFWPYARRRASRNERARRAPTADQRERHAGMVIAPAPGRRLTRGRRNDVRLSVLRARSLQLPQVLRRSTARATSAPGKVPATIIKGVAYHAECVLRILDGRRAHRL